MPKHNPRAVAVLLSGKGRTLANLSSAILQDGLPLRLVGVLSDRPGVAGLKLAADAGIAHTVVAPGGAGAESHSERVFEWVRGTGAELVVLAGFLRILRIPPDFENKVVNIHPSLLPAFGGKGFYGDRVHAAVLERGCTVSGCTVHLVDDQVDHGPILAQEVVPVLQSDTPATLAARVFQAECAVYPRTLAAYATGLLRVEGGRVRRA